MSDRIEWRVVGDPGEGYPPYSFTFADEDEARGFMELVRSGDQWLDGPYLEGRTVIETAWERADPPADWSGTFDFHKFEKPAAPAKGMTIHVKSFDGASELRLVVDDVHKHEGGMVTLDVHSAEGD